MFALEKIDNVLTMSSLEMVIVTSDGNLNISEKYNESN